MPSLVLSRRLRETPFEQRVVENGADHFTIYNKMPLASLYRSLEEDYEHLKNHVQIWDVAAERQVEVVGPDATELVELITPRDVSSCEIGQCLYAPLCDEFGGIVNDPIILKLAEDRYWISIADSDVLLWVKGLAFGRNYDVSVFEPDVSPLAVQGPKADDLMADILGEHVRDIGFFRFIEVTIAGITMNMARSGWSGQGGFELYLEDSSKGLELWDAIWQAGEKYQIRAGCPNNIERLETGLLSFGSDMTLDNNPLQCGLERFIDLDKKAEYMARAALQKIKQEGVSEKTVNIKIDGPQIGALRSTWPVFAGEQEVGVVTSAAYSSGHGGTLTFGYVKVDYAKQGTELSVVIDGQAHAGVVKSRKWQ